MFDCIILDEIFSYICILINSFFMATGFQPNITIKEAIDHIDRQEYLLPSIQRKFVWSAPQIETLFDSIMRGYPINSFMFWHIYDAEIKKNFKFYKFLSAYREFFQVNNPDFDAIGCPDFDAIIDGQQRLTSLYLGLKGTYAYKLPRKWWVNNEDALPTRRLYLNLSSDISKISENEMSLAYDFRFLTDAEYKKLSEVDTDYWFPVREILSLPTPNDVIKYVIANELDEKQTNVLSTLMQRIHQDKLINYYLEDKQDIDAVLDIFIRTNSGGVPLSFSNLLMSITIANWTTDDGSDARKSLADLVTDVFNIGKPGFMISEDFILKTCLVLFKDNIKFNVKNFDSDTVSLFSANWKRIKQCILQSFLLLESWGFNNDSLRAKNAVIPIIYYVDWHNIEDSLLKKTEYLKCKEEMRKWLCIALLKGVFGGQTDTILTRIKNVLKGYTGDSFPLNEMIIAFKGQDRNFTLDNDFIESILKTQKDSPSCYPILTLLYSHMNFENDRYHMDHLHPAASFSKKRLIDTFGSEEAIPSEYYTNPDYWNGVVNLQLLNSGLNESKKDTSLEDWIKQNKVNKETQLIPSNVSYAFKDFVSFYDTRKAIIVNRLKKITEV